MIGFKIQSAEIASDAEHAWAVFCNIAMPIMDAYAPTFGAATVMGWVPDAKQHQLANEAAAHLMQHLFAYDITAHPLYEYGKSGAQSYAEMRIAADEAEDVEIAATAPAARKHALNRTSPKGGPFFGTCSQCGLTDLPSIAVTWACENPANLTRDEALMLAIDGSKASTPFPVTNEGAGR